MPPTDALLYRLYEIVQVFGYPLKSVIHEKFGDGCVFWNLERERGRS